MISCDLASDLKSYEQMVIHRKIKDQNDHRTYSNIWLQIRRSRKKARFRKIEIFRFPVFRITCIIRKLYTQKIRPPFSSGYEFSGLKILMAVWCWVQNVIASSPLVMLC